MRELYSTQLAITVGILILLVSVVFALRQAPELLRRQEASVVGAAMPVPHPVGGMEACRYCHGLEGAVPYPAKHTGWSDESCLKCHSGS
ncbi:MAG TPA: hypothetical protein ENN98_07300 [Desulfurivibrio alkaliphilus]|uniref:Uncharacterized protein n=1 Tax=Desulfurivibrio alkaliphilus TaxID=427923 RepID=A0A7C2TH29_9BACT|nr:hypothetical protein [Desulfurivibrio alkaliphilus]